MTVRTDLIPDSLVEDKSVQLERLASGVIETFRNMLRPELGSSYLPRGERPRQPKEAKDLDGALILVKQCIEDKQTVEGIPLDKRLVFTEEYPGENLSSETITFSLVRREPGIVSKGKPLVEGVQELKPHVRSIDPDPNIPGKVIITLGQKFDHEVLLVCWAKTNKQANFRARWLENMLREYTWFIKQNGVEEFLFMGQGEDLILDSRSYPNIITGRPLHYYIRTETLTHLSEETIRRVLITYSVGSDS